MFGEKYSGIEFFQTSGRQAGHRPLDPRWKEPRFPAMEFSGPGPRIAPFLREMENFR